MMLSPQAQKFEKAGFKIVVLDKDIGAFVEGRSAALHAEDLTHLPGSAGSYAGVQIVCSHGNRLAPLNFCSMADLLNAEDDLVRLEIALNAAPTQARRNKLEREWRKTFSYALNARLLKYHPSVLKLHEASFGLHKGPLFGHIAADLERYPDRKCRCPLYVGSWELPSSKRATVTTREQANIFAAAAWHGCDVDARYHGTHYRPDLVFHQGSRDLCVELAARKKQDHLAGIEREAALDDAAARAGVNRVTIGLDGELGLLREMVEAPVQRLTFDLAESLVGMTDDDHEKLQSMTDAQRFERALAMREDFHNREHEGYAFNVLKQTHAIVNVLNGHIPVQALTRAGIVNQPVIQPQTGLTVLAGGKKPGALWIPSDVRRLAPVVNDAGALFARGA